MSNLIINALNWINDESGQVNIPSWAIILLIIVVIFAVVVLIGGSCTIGDESITAG